MIEDVTSIMAILMMVPARGYIIYCIDNEKYGPFNILKIVEDWSYSIFRNSSDPVEKSTEMIIAFLLIVSIYAPFFGLTVFALGGSNYLVQGS